MPAQSLFHFTLFSLAMLVCNPLLAEGHHANSPSFKQQQLSENIWMLQGKGGNIAVFKNDQGLIVIDDDYEKMSEALVGALQPFGGTDKLNFVINTHWHGDHTQGNFVLGNSAPIVAHDNVRLRLKSRQEIKLFKMVSEPYPVSALPSITYQQALTLHQGNETIEIVHLPGGHTDGDSVVFFKEANVVHMGDHFFAGFFPFVDVDSGGNVLTMAKNVQQILTQINEQTKVIPGHGPLSDKAGLQAFHDMLIGTAEEVQAMKTQGMCLSEIQKQGLSKKWDEWTDGFLSSDSWISIVFQSL
jgi:cyclase